MILNRSWDEEEEGEEDTLDTEDEILENFQKIIGEKSEDAKTPDTDYNFSPNSRRDEKSG